ncbi:MAG: hypothetical protein WEE64_12880 [Dehalococcoidia bacterium]
MFKAIAKLVIGTPRISEEERELGLAYFRNSTAISALQTREADRYNSALMIHMNNLDRPESVQVLLDASLRLALCAKECIRRHALVSPVPDVAGPDYAAWMLVYQDYSVWIEATHDAFVALSRGLTPATGRVRELFAVSEKQRKVAEAEGRKLLRALGLKASDLPALAAAGQEAMDTVDWEPPADAV